jgi:hypothetical protein
MTDRETTPLTGTVHRPCDPEQSWDAAQELFLQLKIENGDA